MRAWQLIVSALLLLCLAISPAAATWSPPTDTGIYGVEWNASDPSPALTWIDENGDPISEPDFDNHVVWGNVKKVLLDDNNVVTRDINPRGNNLDMSGASGKVMTEIPAFYVKSENASTESFRYYRWWISPYNETGFTLHPAFVQRGGTERDNIYVGSYEATLRVLDDGTLALDSRSGEQPWTGYGGSQPLDGMFKLAFDGGTTAPAIGATVTGTTSGTAGQVVDLYVSSGSWANSDVAGFLVLKQTSGTFTNDEPLTVSGSQFAAADTPNGNAGIVATINDFEAAGEALGDGYGAMNVWTYSAIRMLHLVEYANWGSQETVGLGIVSKASGTGFNGEVTGFNSVDSNVNEWGTGTGTGTAALTPASYRTMTDLWGNSWEWVTGYTSTNTEYQIVKRDGTGSLATHPLTAGSYESSEATPLGADGYVSGWWTSLFHEDLLQYQFIANSVTGGSQSTYGTDYQHSHNPGTRVLRAGGAWDTGWSAGLGDLRSYNAASDSVRYVGARLEFTGAATLNGAAPAAQYTQNASAGNAPFAVAFTDTSTDSPGWWRWDFGDGTTSTEQSPTHTYTEPGTYEVTLTAYTLYGEDTTSQTVEVRAPPVATFTQNTTEGNAPLAVAFTDASTGNVTAWSWSFGDDETSAEQSPVHTYEVAGIYTVTLNASNPYGFSLNTTVISVLDPPVAGFSANTTVIPTGSAVAFTDTSTGNVTAWSWSFGDGETSSQQSPVHVYAAPGLYSVTLNASNLYGHNLSTRTDYIDVGDLPVPEFSANATVGGLPFAVAFTDASSGSPTAWNWIFGDGFFSEDQHPVHTYESPGVYTVTLTATNQYGSNQTARTDYIDANYAPRANFTADLTVIPAGGTVTFTDTSANAPTSWVWTFGDGNTSTAQSPAHTYGAAGTYEVTLTVSNAYGSDTETKVTYIDVGLPPAANFSANATGGNTPLAVQFTDTSTGTPTAWIWAFGDGNTSTAQNPSHTYVTAGTYTVNLTATNAYGEDTETKTELVTALTPATASFTTNVTGGNAPQTVQFTDTSTGDVTGWSWTFGDGNTSTDQNPSHTYAAAGTYTVTLNASNAYNYDLSTQPDLITVLTLPAAAFIANATLIPVGGTILFTDASTGDITGWAWTFGDGETSTDQSPSHTYSTAGLQTVSLTVSNPYGEDTETQTGYIDVGYPPAANFTPSATLGAVPVAITFTDTSANTPTAWLWDFGDGNTSTAQHPTHTYTAAGTYTVNLTATNAYGEDSETKTGLITLYDPVTANFTADTTAGLVQLAVQFSDTSTGDVTGWSWNFGDSTTSTEKNPAHTYAAEGNYTVTLTASNPADEDAETKTEYIKVFDPVTAAFTVDETLGLTPLTVRFTSTGTGTPATWAWDFGDGAASSEQNPAHTYTKPGTYTVTLTVADGIIGENPPLTSDTETQTGLIAAYAPLVPDFSATPRTGYIPLTVQFTDTSTGFPTTWLWNFGDGNTSTQQNPSHTYTALGTYPVTLTVSHAADEQTETKADYIIADYRFTAAFTQNLSYGMVPLAVQFTSTTDTSVATPSGYLWTFGGGATSTQQHPVHVYTTPGYYTVTLTVYGVGTENTATHPSAVHAGILPTVAFSGTPTTGTAPLTVAFTATCSETTSYLWTFGDGSTSTAQNPSHTYATPGTYTVTLTGTNLYGSTVTTRTDYITATHVPPVASFTAAPTSGHAPVPVRFTDTSTNAPTAWHWDFGDGETSILRHPTHIYRTAGTYPVTLTVTNPGGSDAVTKTNLITIYAAGDPGYTARYPASDLVVTLAATGLGTQEAVLNGELAAAADTEVWFEYGTKSNSYGFRSVPVTAEPGSLIQTPLKRFPLIAGQTYYYRAACADGYGAEKTFTLPTLSPHPTTTYGAAADQFLYSFEEGDTMIQDMTEATWSPYVATLGALFFGLVIGAIFINLAMKGHSIAIPALLVMVIGGSLWAFVPPEFIIIAQAFVILGIGGLIYYIYTKRKL